MGLPRPAHVVIAVEENHSYAELLDARAAPFLASLAARGSVLTQSYAVAHPSQPNYLAMFSGSTQHVTGDSCPQSFTSGNLGRSLLDAGDTFVGYSEDQPTVGYSGCSSGSYARKHNPWSDFTDLPTSANQPLTAFPTDFATLPTVSFVIPNEAHDMHSGTIADGDTWLRQHLQAYAAWAALHDSLLVVTADEDDYGSANRILTLLYGAHVRAGTSAQRVDHYSLLRTLEDMYGLPRLGLSAGAQPISGVWAG
jgi:acid phosphatase